MKYRIIGALVLLLAAQVATAQGEVSVYPFRMQAQVTTGVAGPDGSISPRTLTVNQATFLTALGYPSGWVMGAALQNPYDAAFPLFAFNPKTSEADYLGAVMCLVEVPTMDSASSPTTRSQVLCIFTVGIESGLGTANAPPTITPLQPLLIAGYTVESVTRENFVEPTSSRPSVGRILSILPTSGNFGIGLTCSGPSERADAEVDEEECGYALGNFGHFTFIPGRPIGVLQEMISAEFSAAAAESSSRLSQRLTRLMNPR